MLGGRGGEVSFCIMEWWGEKLCVRERRLGADVYGDWKIIPGF